MVFAVYLWHTAVGATNSGSFWKQRSDRQDIISIRGLLLVMRPLEPAVFEESLWFSKE